MSKVDVRTDAACVRVEIRAGEGGEDARLFVAELAESYLRLAARKT